jgi:hypothetical protein
LAQAQKNVEDLLAQNTLLIAAQIPPPLNHDAVEGTNPNGNPERSGEKGEPRTEDRVEPINPVPPPPTDAEKRLQQVLLDLDMKYNALSRTMDQKRDGKNSLVDNLFQHKESIFTEEVSNFDLPERFKVPEISLFSGSEDPVEHLDNFRSHVSLHKTPDAVACRAFPLTLLGKARDWLRNLPPRSIDNFDTLWKEVPGPVCVREDHKETQRVSTLCTTRTKRILEGLSMEIQPGKVGDRKCARRLHLRRDFPRIEERRTVDGRLGVETTEGSPYFYGEDGQVH